MKTILHSLKGGGSGRGLSYYSRWAKGCPRKATLDSRAAEEFSPGSEDDNDAFGIGSILHGFMELHYKRGVKGVFDTSAVKFTDSTVHDEHLAVAEALFRSYRVNHSPLELGKVLEVEVPYPRVPREAALIETAVGVSPYTFKADLVVKIGLKEMRRLETIYQCLLPKPGIYIVDHKTDGFWDASALDRYLNKLQFTAYMLAYNAANPSAPCLGLIANILMKTKGFAVCRIYVPLPSPQKIHALHAFLRYCVTTMKTMGDWPVPNEFNCFPRGKVCYWKTTGDCKGY